MENKQKNTVPKISGDDDADADYDESSSDGGSTTSSSNSALDEPEFEEEVHQYIRSPGVMGDYSDGEVYLAEVRDEISGLRQLYRKGGLDEDFEQWRRENGRLRTKIGGDRKKN